jgi:hypothetical protein
VQHAFAARGQPLPGGGHVQQPKHRAAAGVRAVRALAGMIDGPADDVTQDVPAAVIDAKAPRRMGVAGGGDRQGDLSEFQVMQPCSKWSGRGRRGRGRRSCQGWR